MRCTEPYGNLLLGIYGMRSATNYWDRLGRRHAVARKVSRSSSAIATRLRRGAPAKLRTRTPCKLARPTHYFLRVGTSWEDWAESWAHYLHVVDKPRHCVAFRPARGRSRGRRRTFSIGDLYDPQTKDGATRHLLVNSWVQLTTVLN